MRRDSVVRTYVVRMGFRRRHAQCSQSGFSAKSGEKPFRQKAMIRGQWQEILSYQLLTSECEFNNSVGHGQLKLAADPLHLARTLPRRPVRRVTKRGRWTRLAVVGRTTVRSSWRAPVR